MHKTALNILKYLKIASKYEVYNYYKLNKIRTIQMPKKLNDFLTNAFFFFQTFSANNVLKITVRFYKENRKIILIYN